MIIALPIADPYVWLLVILTTALEVIADIKLMAWLGTDARGWTSRLVAVQLATWFTVVAGYSWLMAHGKSLTNAGGLVMEVMIVVAEVALLRLVSVCPRQGMPATPLGLLQACFLSVVGNGITFGTILGIVTLIRHITA